jgi:integrase
MPKIKLTHRRWLTDYLDDTLTGFGVRVHHTGRKAFFVRYDLGTGRKRLTIGTYPTLSLADARDQAKDILGRVARGEDPQQEKRADRHAITFRQLAEQYLELHAKRRKKSWREDERILEVDLLPAWKRRKAKDIGRRDVAELLDGIVERGAPIMANRTKALVSKIYNFGLGRDLVDHNPCLGVPMPAKAKQSDRVLSEDEIRSLWQALDGLDPVMAATFKMRLLTAQRGVEVLSMRWEHIDGAWWTIPAEVSKNGLTHRVPLAPQTQQLLEQLRPLTGDSEWVFASPRKPGAHITAVQKAAERLVRETGVEFVPHDLRRTAASCMTSVGISRLVVSKILNHVESGITAVYDRHSYDAEKREALTTWADKLELIVANGPSVEE